MSHVTDLTPLDDETVATDLLDRFGNFDDAVLVGVHLMLAGSVGQRWAELKLLAQEGSNGGGDWLTVFLRVESLTRFRVAEGPSSYLVLSDGLALIRGPSTWLLQLGSPDDVDAPFFLGSSCAYGCTPVDS